MRTFTMAAIVALGFVSCRESTAHAPAVAPVSVAGAGEVYPDELRPERVQDTPRTEAPGW